MLTSEKIHTFSSCCKVKWPVKLVTMENRIRVPTRTGKMGRQFPVREKLGNFEQTGKLRGNHTKYWKIQRISEKYCLLFFGDI